MMTSTAAEHVRTAAGDHHRDHGTDRDHATRTRGRRLCGAIGRASRRHFSDGAEDQDIRTATSRGAAKETEADRVSSSNGPYGRDHPPPRPLEKAQAPIVPRHDSPIVQEVVAHG